MRGLWFLVANLVTTSKALVPSSVALVTNSLLLPNAGLFLDL